VVDPFATKVFAETGWVDDPASLHKWLESLSRPVVFTNGCFDLLHRGHVTYLAEAAALGRSLVVGVNDDASVRAQNKGSNRPIVPLEDRMAVLAALESVDAVIAFAQPTPLELIQVVQPEILVKGGDWSVDKIVGGPEVRAWGGTVHSIAFQFERSTSGLVEHIKGI